MQGLRERQKISRRTRILDTAKEKFQTAGYSNVKIEDIAHASEVSAVTVYNYFGSKAGLLLALVGESDVLLIEKIDDLINEKHDGIIPAVQKFGRILRRHAMAYLQKPTWREVIAASIQEGSREFGKTYTRLDAVLIEKMEDLLVALQNDNKLGQGVSTKSLADCLFSLQNIRFFQFVADDTISNEEVDNKFKGDLISLQKAFEL